MSIFTDVVHAGEPVARPCPSTPRWPAPTPARTALSEGYRVRLGGVMLHD